MGFKTDAGAALAVAAAVVGAGFASGREVAAFFSSLGGASWVGVALAGAGIGHLTRVIASHAAVANADSLPEVYGAAAKGVLRNAMRVLYGLMMLLTSSAMIAASGELFALTLPLRLARPLGALVTLAAACFAARAGVPALAGMGLAVAPAVCAFFVIARCTGEAGEATFSPNGLLLCAPYALMYAAFNAAVAGGVTCLAARRGANPARMGRLTALFVLLPLAAANAALTRAGADVRGAVLPSVLLAARWGVAGYYASAAVLYLAVFSTLCATLASLNAQCEAVRVPRALAPAACLAASMIGFQRIVGMGYPLLGYLCAALLLALPMLKRRG